MKKYRFYLMTEKGFNVLKSLVEAGLMDQIELVVIGIDEGTLNDFSTEIRDLCIAENVPFKSVESPIPPGQFDYCFVVSWRWIIRDIDQQKLIILHDSLLPKYRGFSPLVNQLINGETKLGVTAFFAKDDYDTGDVILQKSITVQYPLKITQAISMISELYGAMVVEIIQQLVNTRSLETRVQDESEATYSLWRNENDYWIDWTRDAEYINRFIDSVGYPFKGALTSMNGQKVRILEAKVEDEVIVENRAVGKVIFVRDDCPVVVCGEGLLKITSMNYDNNGNSALPLKIFRTIFCNEDSF